MGALSVSLMLLIDVLPLPIDIRPLAIDIRRFYLFLQYTNMMIICQTQVLTRYYVALYNRSFYHLISSWFLFACSPSQPQRKISHPISHIINHSISSEVVPSVFKIARVKPLFKKGSRLEVGNYRPVSILPVLSKLLERAVNNQLNGYLKV